MSEPAGHRAAVLTPPGAGAIGLIRIVGPDPVSLVSAAFRPKSGRPLSLDAPDRLRYGLFVDGDETLDDVIACTFTINGYRAVDISAHGGVRVMERILQTLQRLGAEVCESGDAADWVWPTRSRIDRDCIEAMTHAKTERAVRFLAFQRDHLPAAIESIAHRFADQPDAAAAELRDLAGGFRFAERLLNGVTIALIGSPNSGKSTLFNRLLGRSAVVVSPIAGTTRDWVAEPIEIGGVPVTLIDTAGRRQASSPLEELAIQAGRRMAERAELSILVLDATCPFSEPPPDFTATTKSPDVLMVLNKTDLAAATAFAADAIPISALTGKGLDVLAACILEVLKITADGPIRLSLFTGCQMDSVNAVLSVLPESPTHARQLLLDRFLSQSP